MSADEIFVKTDARNLPKVDVFMIGEYLIESSEIRWARYEARREETTWEK
jgi:hypothetical protein